MQSYLNTGGERPVIRHVPVSQLIPAGKREYLIRWGDQSHHIRIHLDGRIHVDEAEGQEVCHES